MGLWSAIWNPLVCVYTSANRWDTSAQRVLTMVNTEMLDAIRVGLSTAEAVNGFVARFIAAVEEEYRRITTCVYVRVIHQALV